MDNDNELSDEISSSVNQALNGYQNFNDFRDRLSNNTKNASEEDSNSNYDVENDDNGALDGANDFENSDDSNNYGNTEENDDSGSDDDNDNYLSEEENNNMSESNGSTESYGNSFQNSDNLNNDNQNEQDSRQKENKKEQDKKNKDNKDSKAEKLGKLANAVGNGSNLLDADTDSTHTAIGIFKKLLGLLAPFLPIILVIAILGMLPALLLAMLKDMYSFFTQKFYEESQYVDEIPLTEDLAVQCIMTEIDNRYAECENAALKKLEEYCEENGYDYQASKEYLYRNGNPFSVNNIDYSYYISVISAAMDYENMTYTEFLKKVQEGFNKISFNGGGFINIDVSQTEYTNIRRYKVYNYEPVDNLIYNPNYYWWKEEDGDIHWQHPVFTNNCSKYSCFTSSIGKAWEEHRKKDFSSIYISDVYEDVFRMDSWGNYYYSLQNTSGYNNEEEMNCFKTCYFGESGFYSDIDENKAYDMFSKLLVRTGEPRYMITEKDAEAAGILVPEFQEVTIYKKIYFTNSDAYTDHSLGNTIETVYTMSGEKCTWQSFSIAAAESEAGKKASNRDKLPSIIETVKRNNLNKDTPYAAFTCDDDKILDYFVVNGNTQDGGTYLCVKQTYYTPTGRLVYPELDERIKMVKAKITTTSEEELFAAFGLNDIYESHYYEKQEQSDGSYKTVDTNMTIAEYVYEKKEMADAYLSDKELMRFAIKANNVPSLTEIQSTVRMYDKYYSLSEKSLRYQVAANAISLQNVVNYASVGGMPVKAHWNESWWNSDGTTQTGGLNNAGYIQWVFLSCGLDNVKNMTSYGRILGICQNNDLTSTTYYDSRELSIQKGMQEVYSKTSYGFDFSTTYRNSNIRTGDLVFTCYGNISTDVTQKTNIVGIYLGQDADGRNVYIWNDMLKGVTIANNSDFDAGVYKNIYDLFKNEAYREFDMTYQSYRSYFTDLIDDNISSIAQHLNLLSSKDEKAAVTQCMMNMVNSGNVLGYQVNNYNDAYNLMSKMVVTPMCDLNASVDIETYYIVQGVLNGEIDMFAKAIPTTQDDAGIKESEKFNIDSSKIVLFTTTLYDESGRVITVASDYSLKHAILAGNDMQYKKINIKSYNDTSVSAKLACRVRSYYFWYTAN